MILAGPSSNDYQYALVSGGPPTIETTNGLCTTGRGFNNSGLWIFSRTQVASAQEVQQIEAEAQKLGYDTSVLNPVAQEGCLYPFYE